MSKKWCIWTFVSALALLIAIQERVDVPNQEIILHFEIADINSNEAVKTLDTVKKQLRALGIVNTKVLKDVKNGILRIQYYSKEKVEVVQNILSTTDELALQHIFYNDQGNQSVPVDGDTTNSGDYSISVFEIHTTNDSGLEFNGIYIPEIKYITEGHLDSNIYRFHNDIAFPERCGLWENKMKVSTSVVLSIQERSFKIPQVRAGPTS